MAQAARLIMRMQKEMKLLLSDPPHGASFPLLSSAAAGSLDPSTFSTIDAQIQGPEDTVYANGIFDVKIQIPERYPFQPPIVAFATPIYHPNIDNSGRICLDILNLPPKGAWQPSLNISTVLMSIRLLLGEPNPDDGLMCEVSREYKYNRQTFDYKAREMTEKYAKVKADGCSTSLQMKNHGDEKARESGTSVLSGNEDGIKVKLTVESSLRIAHTVNHDIAAKHQEEDGNGKRKGVVDFCVADTSGRIGTSRKKLSLALPPHSQKKDFFGEEPTNEVSAACREDKKANSNRKKQPYDDSVTSSSFRASTEKIENNRLKRKLSLRPLGESGEVRKTLVLAQMEMEMEMNQNEDARSWDGEFENSGLDETAMPESVVVLDSDDSGKEEEERVSLRSRLSLAKRRGLKC